jgi:phosphatidylglycerophosphatase A
MPKNKAPVAVDFKKILSDWRYFVGYGFGSGLLPKMPGTWGSLLAIPIAFLLAFLPFYWHAGIILIYFFVGVYVSEFLSQESGLHDHGPVNCDEVFGYLLTMLPFQAHLFHLILAFILFRFFDILKPFPISWIDKNVGGGFGMMLDDLAAALISMGAMSMILFGIRHFL